jgi:F0F1-type ATP synthase membrane subunit b/b'
VAERNADEIQREIERSRAALAEAVDQLAYRASPKRIKDSVREKARTTQGKVAIGVAGGVIALLIIRRVRKH